MSAPRSVWQVNAWTFGAAAGERTVPETLAAAKAAGFEGVELAYDGRALGAKDPDADRAVCEGYRREADRAGVRLASLATGQYWRDSLSSPDAAERARALDFTDRYLNVAKWLGVPVVLALPGVVAVPWMPEQKAIPYAVAWRHATESAWRCAEMAERAGVTLAFENVWNAFLTDPVAMRTFVDQFASPRVGVYFDTGNCVSQGFPEHWIDVLGNRIKAVHIKNYRREPSGGGGMAGFVADLFGGDVDWDAVLARLRAWDYAGPFAVEMPPAGPDAGHAAAMGKAVRDLKRRYEAR